MPRVPVLTLDAAPEESRDALVAIVERFGRVPNIHGEMANAPALLRAHEALAHTLLAHGSLPPRTREAIALAISAVNECGYCQAAHTTSAWPSA